MRLRRGILAALMAVLGAAHADLAPLELLTVRHRPAAELLSVLQPLLAPGGVIQASDATLIVRTTPANLAEIKKILAELDRPARRLRIIVRQTRSALTDAAGADARIRSTERDVDVRGRVFSTRERGEGERVQEIQALEGRPARIAAAVSLPVHEQTTEIAGGIPVTREHTRYEDVVTSFEVVPVLTRDGGVKLEITAQAGAVSDTPRAGAIQRRQLVTSVEGKLDEWIDLGGTAEEWRERGSGIIYSTGLRGSGAGRVYVKIIALP